MSFGEAVTALKEGKRVQRVGWNGKGLFIFMQIPADIDIDIVPKMQSLPQSVKDEFIRRSENPENEVPVFQYIRYRNQLAMVYPDNHIYGWLPSPTDVLSSDWTILD